MNSSNVIVRAARREDALTIARVVAMAIGDEQALQAYCGDKYLDVLTEVACHRATQYSWQYALIAEVNGVAAGAVVGYDGARLEILREGTFAVLQAFTGSTPNIANETEAGEYYLDSVGVLPEFRGIGVGQALITAFCDKAYAEGAERVGLIVDYDNPSAEKLYLSLGFEYVGERTFFGHQMRHLQRKNNWNIRERVMRSVNITEFQRRVYLELLNIPRGDTISYGELARRIGCRSAQAVGQALKRNPFAPDVPCHRVVAVDGSLCGYNGRREGAEIERKRKLLASEHNSRK